MARLLTVQQIVSQASMEVGIAQRPVAQVAGSYDQDVVQMSALLAAVADELLLDEPYVTQLGDGVWVTSKDGEPKAAPDTDTDLVLFDGRLAIDSVKWRFLAAKGLEFGEPMRDYTNRLNKLASRANGRVLDLDIEEDRIL
jgi:hypothetical protein